MEYSRDDKQEEEPQPSLGIENSVSHMVPFPNTRADTHLIHSETFDRDQLVVTMEELCFHRRVRHEDKYDNRESHGKGAAEKENDLLPAMSLEHWIQSRVARTYLICVQRGINMAESVGQQAS